MDEHRINRRRLLLLTLFALGGTGMRRAHAEPEMQMHGAMNEHADMADMHAHEHHHHAMSTEITRSEVRYKLPALTLVRQDGAQVAFPQAIEGESPILLNFIYTSCTTICPLTSQIFREVQDKLGAERDQLRMVSISIDPEYDTPARLRTYARKFHAGPQWSYYTGTMEASIAMQKAFDVYRGDKMNHSPVTFLRVGAGSPWLRLDGFATPDLLLSEYRRLTHHA